MSVKNRPIGQKEEREEEEGGRSRGAERGRRKKRRTDGQSFYMSHGRKLLLGRF